jgi:fibronectin-binding autotransporter adhesin
MKRFLVAAMVVLWGLGLSGGAYAQSSIENYIYNSPAASPPLSSSTRIPVVPSVTTTPTQSTMQYIAGSALATLSSPSTLAPSITAASIIPTVSQLQANLFGAVIVLCGGSTTEFVRGDGTCNVPAGGGGSLTLTDGTHTVTPTTQITVTGGTVGGSTPNATLTITGGGGGTVTSVGTTAPLSGGPITGSGNIALGGPSNLTTFTAGTLPMGAGASAFVPSEITDVASGGVTVGSPTGGQKGAGTINMTGCFINNVACASGGSTAFSAITGGTNTSAAMVVGTGASIAASGSGAITATAAPWAGITGTPTTLAGYGITSPLPTAQGGTAQNSSASTGVAQVAAGTWSFSTALANGTTATTQSVADNTTKVATDAFVIANATGGTVTLNPGLAATPGTYNSGAQTITNGSTLSTQLFYEPHTTSYSLASTDGGKLPTFTAASQTATFPNPGSIGSSSFQFGYDGTHSYSITTAGGTASIYGCGTTGTTVSGIAYQIQLVADGTNWQCIPSGGTGGGSGTVNSGTANQLAYYATSTNAVSSNTHLTETGSLHGVDYNTASLPAAQTGTVLQVANADGTSTRIEADAFGAQAFFTGVASGGTKASPTAVTAGTQGGGYNTWFYNGTSVVGPLASLRTFANELQAAAGTHGGTYVDITATPNGSQTAVSQMQIVPSAGGSGGGGGAGVNFTLGTSHTPTALTDASTIAVDASKGSAFSVTLTTSRTLGFPTNLPTTNQQTMIFEVTQPAGGGAVLTLGSGYSGTIFLNPKPNAVTTFQCTSTSSSTAQCVGGFQASLASFTIGSGANQVPTCSATYEGWLVFVTDAAAVPVYNVTQAGGGSTVVPVFCNGSNWTNH